MNDNLTPQTGDTPAQNRAPKQPFAEATAEQFPDSSEFAAESVKTVGSAAKSADSAETAEAGAAQPRNLSSELHTAERYYGARKRLFIGLMTLSAVFLCLILLLVWVVPTVGLANIHTLLPYLVGVLFAGLMGSVVWTSLALVLHIVMGRPMLGSHRLRGITVQVFLPIMVLLGKALGIEKQEIRHSFIRVNNELLRAQAKSFAPQEILILLPHCLQNADCGIRLSYDVTKCKRCGKCPLAGLLALRDHYGVSLAIATGGTIARRIVVQTRPKLIIAVACERDLSSGIQDVYPLPTFGVLNERPQGPCFNTQVSLPLVEKALQLFLAEPPAPLHNTVRREDVTTPCATPWERICPWKNVGKQTGKHGKNVGDM